MNVKNIEKKGNEATIVVEIDKELMETGVNKAYTKARKNIMIPGFRKGKAPRKMIEQMYGKEVFYEDAANALIPEAYDKAMDECTEDIVSSPKIDVVQLEAGKPFIFTAEVALKPEVTLGKYKGVKVDKMDVEVTDAEVEAEIDKEREKNSRTVEVTDRAVKEGDTAVIDFEGFVDGVAFEGGKGEDYPLTIGSHTFIPGFEEALVGAEIGKETDVNVTFPEDYQAEELAGKAAVFKCTVKKIQEKQLPDLDDDFVSEVSEEADTVEQYKEEVKKAIADRKAAAAKSAKEQAVIEAIIADSKMDIPEPMIATQQRQMIQDFAQRVQSQGLSMEQYMQFTGTNVQMLLEQVKPQALTKIQSRLVLEAIVKAEGIETTEEEFLSDIKEMAETYKMDVEKALEVLGENGKKQVKEDIAIRKAVDFVVENAKEAKPAAKKSTAKKTKEAKAEEAEATEEA